MGCGSWFGVMRAAGQEHWPQEPVSVYKRMLHLQLSLAFVSKSSPSAAVSSVCPHMRTHTRACACARMFVYARVRTHAHARIHPHQELEKLAGGGGEDGEEDGVREEEREVVKNRV